MASSPASRHRRTQRYQATCTSRSVQSARSFVNVTADTCATCTKLWLTLFFLCVRAFKGVIVDVQSLTANDVFVFFR
jgi:hypothetical protein